MIEMAENDKLTSDEKALGPSIILGLVGAIVVLLVLAGAIWGVGRLISNIRDNNGEEDQQEETVAEEDSQEDTTTEENGEQDDGEITDEAATEEVDQPEDSEAEDTSDEESPEDSTEPSQEDAQDDGEEEASEEDGEQPMEAVGAWVANNYQMGEITGDKYTVVWGDTLWEIAEAKYGSGFEWNKIQAANAHIVGRLPNGSMALIIPGQVLSLP